MGGTQTVRTLSNAKEYQLDFSDSTLENTQTLLEFWYGHTDKALDCWLTKTTSAVKNLVKKEHFKVYFDKPEEAVTSILYFAEGAMQKNKYLVQ